MQIAHRQVGPGHPVYIIAEIGINHNGCMDDARALILAAADAGCNAVKFQKRTVAEVYTEEELARPRQSPFGDTNGALKYGLEFNARQYYQLTNWAGAYGLDFFASCWDTYSVDFMEQFNPPCYKIASASLTDIELVSYTAATGKPVLLSTGMSTLPQIDAALRVCGDNAAVLHCVSTYPSRDDELNLACIQTLASRYDVPIGYSGHELGLATTVAAVAMGACIVERHLTLDRAKWGSDQAASIEPHAMARLVRDIRAVEAARGDGHKRVLDSERPIMEKLRRVG